MANFSAQRRRSRRKVQGGIALHFPVGIRIYDPDHPSRRVYLLKTGHVRLWHGPRAIVEQLAPGSFFGEKCLLNYRSEEIAKTLSPVTVTAYRKSELFERLKQEPVLARKLLKNLALRIDRCEDTIRDFVTEGSERRLARLLYRFLPVRPASDWVRLPLGATNSELAKMIGTTRWRVSHFLNHFQRLGWLSRRKEGMWICREGLRGFLESQPQESGPKSGRAA